MIVMVCVGMASVVLLVLLRLAVAQGEVARTEARRLQTGWLVESALERAAARLYADEDYQGELWQVTPQSLGSRDGAVVRIDVERVPKRPAMRRVRVRADYPQNLPHRVRQSKRIEMEVHS